MVLGPEVESRRPSTKSGDRRKLKELRVELAHGLPRNVEFGFSSDASG